MGYKMRTPQWSVTQWVAWDNERIRPNWNQTVGLELYDHKNDTGWGGEGGRVEGVKDYCGLTSPFPFPPTTGMGDTTFDDFEVVNLAEDPAYRSTLEQLLAQLRQEVEKWITPGVPPTPPPS